MILRNSYKINPTLSKKLTFIWLKHAMIFLGLFCLKFTLWSKNFWFYIKNPSKNSPKKAMCFSTFHLIFSILGCAYLELMSDSTTLNIIYMLAALEEKIFSLKRWWKYIWNFFYAKNVFHIYFSSAYIMMEKFVWLVTTKAAGWQLTHSFSKNP